MGAKTITMLCIVAYRLYAKNKPIKSVNFHTFLQKGGKVHEISIIQ
jgi:hypothetical protein